MLCCITITLGEIVSSVEQIYQYLYFPFISPVFHYYLNSGFDNEIKLQFFAAVLAALYIID